MINRWQCWLIGLWWSIKNNAKFKGCDYEEEEFHTNVDVTICKCRRCGKYDIGWGKNLKG